jgi:hypothetical protein
LAVTALARRTDRLQISGWTAYPNVRFLIGSTIRWPGREWLNWVAMTHSPAGIRTIHDRQMVILERSNWSAWLQETGNEKELLRALPEGSLVVEQVR